MLLEEQRESAVAPERHPDADFPRRGQMPLSGPDKRDTRSPAIFYASVIDPLSM